MESILVIGLGKSGHGLLAFFKEKAVLSVYDDKRPDLEKLRDQYGVEIHDYDPEVFYDLVALSPGPAPDHPVIHACREKGMKILGELEIAFQHLKGDVLAISGTNGKSTTTTLLYEFLSEENSRSFIGGNIGIPLIGYAKDSREGDVYAVEVSSFQLETMDSFTPQISALLNITPDHIVWHGTMDAYVDAKFRLWENNTQNQLKVFNADDAFLVEEINKRLPNLERLYGFSLEDEKNNCFVKEGKIHLRLEDREEDVLPVEELQLKGKHNLSNVLAAVLMAGLYGISKESMARVLRRFTGLSHRYEILGEKQGRRFINDSKATNLESSLPALASAKRPTVLLAGGMDKKVDLKPLFDQWNPQIKQLLVYGEVKKELATLAEGICPVEIHENLEESFNRAMELSSEGWDILLSPACASWDMYKSFEERGDHFRELFRSLE